MREARIDHQFRRPRAGRPPPGTGTLRDFSSGQLEAIRAWSRSAADCWSCNAPGGARARSTSSPLAPAGQGRRHHHHRLAAPGAHARPDRGGVAAAPERGDDQQQQHRGLGPNRERSLRRKVDLLLVSPERFNNADFRDRLLGPLSRSAGLLVVDEAHCISDWGHDFRPDYRRLVRVLELMPPGLRCCAPRRPPTTGWSKTSATNSAPS